MAKNGVVPSKLDIPDSATKDNSFTNVVCNGNKSSDDDEEHISKKIKKSPPAPLLSDHDRFTMSLCGALKQSFAPKDKDETEKKKDELDLQDKEMGIALKQKLILREDFLLQRHELELKNMAAHQDLDLKQRQLEVSSFERQQDFLATVQETFIAQLKEGTANPQMLQVLMASASSSTVPKK